MGTTASVWDLSIEYYNCQLITVCFPAGILYISRIPPHLVREPTHYPKWHSTNACCSAGYVSCSSQEVTPWFCHHLLSLQKPQKLRHMLSQHGEISRLYLAPEGAPCSLVSSLSSVHMPAMCFLCLVLDHSL